MAGSRWVYRFGPFELDPASGRLFRGQERIPLSDTQVAILLLLLSRAGAVVERRDLIQAAWGNSAVNPNSLEQTIRRIRQALARGSDGTVYIETLNNLGYRFAAPVERVERDPSPGSLDELIAPHRAFVQGQTDLDTLDVQRINRARLAFEEALRQAPDYADAHVGLAMALGLSFEATTVNARPDTAALQRGIVHARRGCELAPSSGEAWGTLAFVLYLNEESEEAANAACRAATLDPENARLLLRLAYVSWGDQRLHLARRLLTLGSAKAFAHWLRATVFIARGAFEPALEEVRLGCAAQDAQPRGSGLPAVGLHLLHALLLAFLGRLDEAVAELMRELDWADPRLLFGRECAANTYYALGAIRLRQGDRDAARLAFERALAIAPSHVSAAAALGTELPPSPKPMHAAVGRAIELARANRHADAARVYLEAVSRDSNRSAGWLLPVEPMLNPVAQGDVWAEALALVRVRAT